MNYWTLTFGIGIGLSIGLVINWYIDRERVIEEHLQSFGEPSTFGVEVKRKVGRPRKNL